MNIRARNKLVNARSFSRNRNMSAGLVSRRSMLDDGVSYDSLQDYTNRAYRHSRRIQKLVEDEIQR